MNNYTAVYKLYKEAGFWDDAGNKLKSAWQAYNDYADKNQWVRPAIYGLGGAGAGAGAGLLMKSPVASVLLGLLGGTLGAAGGAIHNNQRGINLNNLNKDYAKKQKAAAEKYGMTIAQLNAGKAKQQKALTQRTPQNINQISGDGYTNNFGPAAAGLTATGVVSLLAALVAKNPQAIKRAWGSMKNTAKAAPLIGALNFGHAKMPRIPTPTSITNVVK